MFLLSIKKIKIKKKNRTKQKTKKKRTVIKNKHKKKEKWKQQKEINRDAMSPVHCHVRDMSIAHCHVIGELPCHQRTATSQHNTMSEPAASNIFPISNLVSKLLYVLICWVSFNHLKLSLILFFVLKIFLKKIMPFYVLIFAYQPFSSLISCILSSLIIVSLACDIVFN